MSRYSRNPTHTLTTMFVFSLILLFVLTAMVLVKYS